VNVTFMFWMGHLTVTQIKLHPLNLLLNFGENFVKSYPILKIVSAVER